MIFNIAANLAAHQTLDDRQPKTCMIAAFGGHAGLKHTRFDRIRDAWALILNGNSNTRSTFKHDIVSGVNRDLAALRHRFGGIFKQVYQYFLEPIAVGDNRLNRVRSRT